MIAPVRHWLRERADVNLAVGLFAIVLIGALWTAVILKLNAVRDDAVASAVKQNTNLAVAYEEHIVRTLKGLDGVLLFMRHEFMRMGAKLDIRDYIEDGVIDGRLFDAISILDEKGDLILGSRPSGPVNYADRDFFRIHQLRLNQDTFHINAPVLGRVSNTWQVPMSRRIIKPDGSFGGVIVLSVDPGYFARFYQKTDIGENGLVLLIGLDGIVRARRVGNVLSFGTDMSGSSLLKEQKQEVTGDFLSLGGVDGLQRFISYRTLPGYPLVVAVGTAQHEVLADFMRNRNRDYALTLLVSAVILLFAAMLMITLARQKRASTALKISEANFRAAFEQAAIGIAHTSMERRYVQVNQKFCDMLGYSREELLGMKVSELRYAGDPGDGSYVQQLLSGEATSLSAEKRYVRKDGSVLWVNRTISMVRDHSGHPLHFLRIVEDITERKRLESEMRELAATDMLTGLPNRRAFIARLESEHARLRRFDAHQAAVLMLDLDYFKRINDTWGHPAGDAVLRQVAQVIRDEIREVDGCGRLGGEEFAIVLAGAAPAAAREFAERLRRTIADVCVAFEDANIRITVSIGVAALDVEDESADVALQRADRALYKAKGVGRDRVIVFTAEA